MWKLLPCWRWIRSQQLPWCISSCRRMKKVVQGWCSTRTANARWGNVGGRCWCCLFGWSMVVNIWLVQKFINCDLHPGSHWRDPAPRECHVFREDRHQLQLLQCGGTHFFRNCKRQRPTSMKKQKTQSFITYKWTAVTSGSVGRHFNRRITSSPPEVWLNANFGFEQLGSWSMISWYLLILRCTEYEQNFHFG